MFEDISLYPLRDKSSYSNIISDSLSLINYGYDIFCKIESDEFQNFINNYSSGVVSRLQTKIIIPVDTSVTKFFNNDFKVNLGLISDGIIEDTYSSSSIYGANVELSYGDGLIDPSNPKLEISIGDLIQYHISKDIPFLGFTLTNDSQSHILNSLYLKNNNAYIYMEIEK